MINPNNVLVSPLFYDALSGEFQPPTDELGRSHTLARLAVATLTKGEQLEGPEHFNVRIAEFVYTPSWASETVVEATCYLDAHRKMAKLSTLHLFAPEADDLSVISYSLFQLPRLNLIRGRTINDNTTRLPIDLGDNLTRTKQIVTAAAQEFFGQLAR